MTLTEKHKLFKEFLENGGIDGIFDIRLLEDLKKVRIRDNREVIAESVSPLVMAAYNAIAGSQLIEPFVSENYIENYHSFVQKNLYFEQKRIDTEEEFDAIYKELTAKEKILFRGVSESKWRLLNSLQRFWIDNKYSERDIKYDDFIIKLIDNAKKIHNDSLVKYLKSIKLDSENDIAILSFLQHYGSDSYTPLLDWTYNLKHSLFFAIDKMDYKSHYTTEIDKYFSIYYLDEEHFLDTDLSLIVKKGLDEDYEQLFINFTKDLKETPDKIEIFKQAMSENAKKLYIYNVLGQGAIRNLTQISSLKNIPIAFISDIYQPNAFKYSSLNSFNIINQEGALIWNNSPNKPLEYLAKEQYLIDHDEDYFFSYCLNINKSLKYYISNLLDKDGITRNFIYPNPDDLANDAFKQTKKNYSP